MSVNDLQTAVLRDQLLALRNTVALSMPINIALGFASLLVAFYAGNGATGAAWFGISTVANVSRILLCRYPLEGIRKRAEPAPDPVRATRIHLILHAFLAFCSGLVWAFVPMLCDWYTSPQTLFYIAVVCGITAGAVTYGYAYALVPSCFVTPPLISSAICLWSAGDFDHYLLAATVFLYLGALIRGARNGESLFANDSRRRNEATALSARLEIATRQAMQYADEMQRSAGRDQLTGILNRRGFTEAAEAEMARGRRMILMMLDLDGFKSINDAFGHRAGDRVLVEVSERIRGEVGPHGIVARLGGDEFAVLVNSDCNGRSFEVLAGRLVEAISQPFVGLDPAKLGVSIGIYADQMSNLDTALLYSDIALYAAKQSGRNQYRLFDEELQQQSIMRRDIERSLGTALEAGALEVWYQPILSSQTQKVASFEALLRWKHETYGWISPEEIISAAASTGHAPELLGHILHQTASMIATMAAGGAGDVGVAVNISPRELAQIGVDSFILESFARFDIPLSMLEIEITEDVAINHTLVREKLDVLAEKGVRIAIDDFGTGYSSLASLQQLHVNRVKIDKTFVTGTTLSSANRSLVDALLRVSRAYGFEVVAEGVETREDFETMRQLGCPFVQGYYFSKAMPKDEAIAWMKKTNAAQSMD